VFSIASICFSFVLCGRLFGMSNDVDGMSNKDDALPGLPASIEVYDADQLAPFDKLPLRAQQIGALLACGFSPGDIDTAFKLPDGTCSVYKTNYYTNKSISITRQTRDLITAAYLRSKSFQLVSSITPTVINQAGLGERVKSASLLMDRAIKLESPDQAQDIGKQISNALSKLASTNTLSPTTGIKAIKE